jgi:hypothetical protein
MKCLTCQNENPNEHKFCSNCGKTLQKETNVSMDWLEETPVEPKQEETPVILPEPVTETAEKPKKKKRKVFMIAAAGILLAAGIGTGVFFLLDRVIFADTPLGEIPEEDVIQADIAEEDSQNEFLWEDEPDYDDYTENLIPPEDLIPQIIKQDLNIWAFSYEIPDTILRYQEMFPDSIVNNFNIIPTIHIDWDGSYEYYIETAFRAGGSNTPDIFMAEQMFVLKFTQGDLSRFTATYTDLGIQDVEEKITAAGIFDYAVNAGRNKDGEVVGLKFQSTGSCFIYRRSIALEVWGTDDPVFVGNKVAPGWDKFTEAAAEIKAAGYAMVYGDDDIWITAGESAVTPWIVDGMLNIDPVRLAYLDLIKTFYDNDYMIGMGQWTDGWFAGMAGITDPLVFGYLGPSWLVNYQISDNAIMGDSFGDWAVTTSPVTSTWGGTWLFAHTDLESDKRAAVAEILEWFTLDTSETGFQYLWANTTFPDLNNWQIIKDTPASQVVMAKSDGSVDILGGQDMFEYFLPAAINGSFNHWHEWDRFIGVTFQDYARMYYQGILTKDEALAEFKNEIFDRLAILPYN